PAVHQKSGERVFVVKGVLLPHPEVVVRNSKGEQQATRVIPVVFGLDDLGSVRRDEFSNIHLQSLAYGRKIRKVSFLQVLIKAQAAMIGGVDRVHRLSETK